MKAFSVSSRRIDRLPMGLVLLTAVLLLPACEDEQPARPTVDANDANAPAVQRPVDPKTSYDCTVCGYRYDPARGDPDHGVRPGTPFADLPEDWVCPSCGAHQMFFTPAPGAGEIP